MNFNYMINYDYYDDYYYLYTFIYQKNSTTVMSRAGLGQKNWPWHLLVQAAHHHHIIYIYIYDIQYHSKVLNSKIFNYFLKKSLLFTKLYLFDPKYSKNSNIVKCF